MRLSEFTTDNQRIDEVNIRKAIGTGAIAAAAALGGSSTAPPPTPAPVARPNVSHDLKSLTVYNLAQKIADRYKVDYQLAKDVVQLALKHEKPTFPKAADILALIGIESSFNPDAVSSLETDPAVGITQIRPGAWGMKASDIQGDLDKQISLTADMLHKYGTKLNNKDDALNAYNVGMTAFKRGDGNPAYVSKFNQERALYK